MTKRPGRDNRARLVRAATALATTIAVLLFAELALYTLSHRPIVMSEWLLRTSNGLDDEAIFSSPAYRSEEHYAVETRPLVVTSGDSFTAGHPVARQDSYPTVLAKLLHARGIEIGLISLGIGDSSPDQQLRLFEYQLLPRAKPDIVVWQFFPNDEYDNVVKAVYTIRDGGLELLDAEQNWLYRRQRFHTSVPAGEWLRQNSYLYRHLLKVFELRQQYDVPRAYRTNPRAWGLEKVRLAVERMRALATTHGFRAYFMLIAPQSLYLTGEARELDRNVGFVQTYQRMVDVLATEPGFIDARFYEDDGVTLQRNIFADDGRDPLAEGGRHFNEDGYRRLAELVAERLLADSVLARANPAGVGEQ